MATPFIAEIVMFGGNFAPRQWALCDGQLLAISTNTALFSLLGTTYGGDGRTTFGLPDLRGRVPVHAGSGPGLPPVTLGQKGGTASTTLTTGNMPSHNHGLSAASAATTVHASTADGDSASPSGAVLATTAEDSYTAGAPDAQLATTAATTAISGATDAAGAGQAFENRPPFQAVNFIIALQGVFPSRN